MNSPTSPHRLLPSFFSPFTVIAIFLLLALIGISVAPMLTFRLHPSVSGSQIYIQFDYFGASAEAVEMEATAPLEGVMGTIEGIENLSSVSGDGWGYVTLTAERKANIEKLRFRVMSVVREIYPKLPEGVSYPSVSSYSAQQEKKMQLLVYTLAGSLDPPAIKSLANQMLLPKLSTIEGVSGVEVYGANVNDWYIEYKPDMLDQLGITPQQIAQAIRQQAYTVGVGAAQTAGGLSVSVSLAGKGINPMQWGSIEVATVGGRIVTLEQVATVQLRERDPNGFFRINGQSAINLVVEASVGANQLAVANGVYAAIEELQHSLPPGLTLQKSYDNTTQLRADLNRNVQRTVFSLGILLLFVLITTRSFRHLLVVSVSLVLNLAIAVLLFYALRLEIHLYSLSGITLSLGLIIDNTLVMVDYLRQRRNLLVFTALLAATLTTIGALASIFFLEEEQRRNLTDFAWVIIINLTVSLAIALFLVPSVIDKVKLTRKSTKKRVPALRRKAIMARIYSRLSVWLYKYKKWGITVGLLIVGLPIFLLPNKVEKEGFWPNVYNKTLGSQFYQASIKPYAEKFLGGTLRLFYNSVWEKSYWGVPERTRVFVNMELPFGSTLEQVDELTKLFESHIVSRPEVEQVIATVRPRSSRIEIFFHPQYEITAAPYSVKMELERLAITQAGADFSIYGVGRGFSNRTSLAWANSRILLTGFNYQQLLSLARFGADSLRKMPRVDRTWIKGGNAWNFNDRSRRFMRLDEDLLLASGISPVNYAGVLQRGAPTSDMPQWLAIGNQQTVVRVRPQGEITTDFMLNYSPIVVDKAQMRNIAAATISTEIMEEEIYKENQQYVITLAYNYIGPDKLIQKVQTEHTDWLNSILPVGFKADNTQYQWWYGESNKQYLMLILMVAIIFLTSSVLFESLRQPLAIICIIPLSMVGVFLTYWFFDLSFDQGTFASFLLLGGLVVNSAIYIINEMNILRRRYPNIKPIACYMRAVNARVVTIALTVISTVLGLLPFVVFGAEPFWFSLAAGTIGGLLFSIPAILLFLPMLPGVFYRHSRSHSQPIKNPIQNN